MKLLSVPYELKALATLTSGNSKVAGRLLAMTDPAHFHYEPVAEAYHRVRSLVKTSGEIPSYQELCVDPVISEENRKLLSKNQEKWIKKPEDLPRLMTVLTKYKKMRGLYFLSEEIDKQLTGEKLDIDVVVEDTANRLTALRTRIDIDNAFVHMGKGNNCTALIKEVLSTEKGHYVPTGFRVFDDRNGGFLLGGLVTLGATSGGGKSALGQQLLQNMSLYEDVCLVPLEMTRDEMMSRITANLAKIPVGKVIQRKLTSNERSKAGKAWGRFIADRKKAGTRFTVYDPDEDQTIEEILMVLRPYGYKVIIIDYISLLKGVDGDDSWQALGRVARYAKIFAKNNNCVVVLMAQVNEDGKIRYSQAIKEHSNLAWVWVSNAETKENGIININQIKARMQDPFPFSLGTDLSTMSVFDVEQSDTSDVGSTEYLDDVSDD